jgi:hypothetical protein
MKETIKKYKLSLWGFPWNLIGIFSFIIWDCLAYPGIPQASKWKIGEYTNNDCILTSSYDSSLGINPIIYILRSEQVKDVIQYVLRENIEETDLNYLTDNNFYLLVEDYTNFRSDYKSKEYSVYLSETKLNLIYQYNRSFFVGGFWGQIFDLSFFSNQPQRNILFFFGEENSQTLFDRKGKLYGYIYRLPSLKKMTKMKLNVVRNETIQIFETDTKYIQIGDELYCEPRDY